MLTDTSGKNCAVRNALAKALSLIVIQISISAKSEPIPVRVYVREMLMGEMLMWETPIEVTVHVLENQFKLLMLIKILSQSTNKPSNSGEEQFWLRMLRFD